MECEFSTEKKSSFWTVRCHKCKKTTPKKNHLTAGDAADHARTVGFHTRGDGINGPLVWNCGCLASKK